MSIHSPHEQIRIIRVEQRSCLGCWPPSAQRSAHSGARANLLYRSRFLCRDRDHPAAFIRLSVLPLPRWTPLWSGKKPGKSASSRNGQLLTTPFLDISDHVNQYLDHGLLGLALDPNFATTAMSTSPMSTKAAATRMIRAPKTPPQPSPSRSERP